ncbi:MAG: DNA-processing protein DprA, partial [Acidobacteriota bacterium]
MRPLHRVRLAELCGGPAEVFRQGRERLGRIAWIRPQTRENIVNSDWKSIALREIETADRHGIHIFSMNMDIFPLGLAEMPDPPVALYLRGELTDRDLESIAIVGPRRPTTYGRMVAEELAGDLAVAGVTVVSGLAEGVDAAAHAGALASGGRTVAFLGSGLDHPYPRANRRLRERIPQSGAVISEFPLGTEPRAWHFPQRNRLIAGLSRGTVVVEAARKSGALITAEHAMELGREVFAVPGPVTSDRSEGTLALIR